MPAMSAAEWNDRYPVGTPVTAYPDIRPEYAVERAAKWGTTPSEVLTLTTHTRTPAWELGHGEPVVSVVGYAGGISLEHIDLRATPAPTSEDAR